MLLSFFYRKNKKTTCNKESNKNMLRYSMYMNISSIVPRRGNKERDQRNRKRNKNMNI